MDKQKASRDILRTHFVDIHEVLPEEEEKEEEEEEELKEDRKTTKVGDNNKVNKFINKPVRIRDPPKRNQRSSFSRQVSLETGFSVLNRESKSKDDRRVLPRSGRSFGGFESANRFGGEARKGDFDIFRTKSTLSKQNSLLPTKKEKETESNQRNNNNKDDENGRFDNESANRSSVPVGRYFAALRGPELDQVKVINITDYIIYTVLDGFSFSYLYIRLNIACVLIFVSYISND